MAGSWSVMAQHRVTSLFHDHELVELLQAELFNPELKKVNIEAISKQAINAVMPNLFRHLSMNGRDPDRDQSGQDDFKYFELASA